VCGFSGRPCDVETDEIGFLTLKERRRRMAATDRGMTNFTVSHSASRLER